MISETTHIREPGEEAMCNRGDSPDVLSPAPKPSRQELVDAEAMRRCVRGGTALDYMAFQDRHFRHDDRRPWWKAFHGAHIEHEIEQFEKAGLRVEVA